MGGYNNTETKLSTMLPPPTAMLYGLPCVNIPPGINDTLIALARGLYELLGGAHHANPTQAFRQPESTGENNYMVTWMCNKPQVSVYELESMLSKQDQILVLDWVVNYRSLELHFGLKSHPRAQEQALCPRLSSTREWSRGCDPLALLRQHRQPDHDMAFHEFALPHANKVYDVATRTVLSKSRELMAHYMVYLAPRLAKALAKDYSVRVGLGDRQVPCINCSAFPTFSPQELCTILKPLIWIKPILVLDDMTLRLEIQNT